MNIFEYLRYCWLCWKNPERRDFIRAGYGILSRYKRCKKYWQPHLKLTKEFIASHAAPLAPAHVSILGAGRLLDVPLEQLSARLNTVTFLDADPGACATWKKASRDLKANGIRTREVVCDLTEKLDTWSKTLRSLPSDSDARTVEHAIQSLLISENPYPRKVLENQDLIISLNLLSQIPLYWEDRVRDLFPRLLQGDEQLFEPLLEAALKKSMQQLECEHLALLSQAKPAAIFLITDEFFHYYQTNSSEWRTEPALSVSCPPTIPGFVCIDADSWWWHLAPQGLEREEYGEIHTVRAFAYEQA